MVSNDQILDIAPENSSNDTVWFMCVIGVNCVDNSSNNIDNYGHNVPKSQPYLLWNFLEKLNDNKKGVVLYQRSKNNVFLYKESILYLIIKSEPNNKKKDLFFLSNNKFIELLNCVQFTEIAFHSFKN